MISHFLLPFTKRMLANDQQVVYCLFGKCILVVLKVVLACRVGAPASCTFLYAALTEALLAAFGLIRNVHQLLALGFEA